MSGQQNRQNQSNEEIEFQSWKTSGVLPVGSVGILIVIVIIAALMFFLESSFLMMLTLRGLIIVGVIGLIVWMIKKITSDNITDTEIERRVQARLEHERAADDLLAEIEEHYPN